jgi:hypothetical protein
MRRGGAALAAVGVEGGALCGGAHAGAVLAADLSTTPQFLNSGGRRGPATLASFLTRSFFNLHHSCSSTRTAHEARSMSFFDVGGSRRRLWRGGGGGTGRTERPRYVHDVSC